MELIRGLFVLSVLLELFVYLVPGKSYRRYIHFFAQVIMTVAFLSPVLSLFWDSEKMMEQIQYEAFVGGLDELSRDTARIEYMQNDYYIKKYELAMAEDVRQIVAGEGYEASEVKVTLSADYTIKEIVLQVRKQQESDIFIAPVENSGEEKTEEYDELRSRLAEDYQIDEEAVVICGG